MSLARLQIREVVQLSPDNRRALGSVPALCGYVGRENFILQLRAQFGRELRAPRRESLGEEAVPAIHEHHHRQVLGGEALVMPRGSRGLAAQSEPVEAIAGECQEIRQLADGRKRSAAEKLDRNGALELGQVDLDRLCGPREIHDTQNRVIAVVAQIDEHFAVTRADDAQRPPAEGLGGLANLQHALHPVEQR